MAIPEQELTGREKSTASQATNSTHRSGDTGVLRMEKSVKKQEFREKAPAQEKTLKSMSHRKKSGSISCFCLFVPNKNTQHHG